MSKKGTKALASATLMSLVLTTALSAGPVKAAAGQVTRTSGADRYATAAQVATTNWTTSDNVVLVSGEGYADAVSASALAKKLNAPILLTTAGSLSSDTKAALSTLKAKKLYVVGGNASVSASVRAELKANYSLVELGGANRYETNAAVAQQLVDLGVDPSNAIMVGGEGFSDALSVAPIAAAKGQILLLGMNDANYMQPVINFVKKNKTQVTVVGTKNVINETIYSAVNAVKRVDGGQDRFDTNLKVLAAFKDTVKMDHVFVANASGNGYADALVASAIAGKTAAPLVLVDKDGTTATSNAVNYIQNNATKTTDLNVVGGTGVVSESTVTNINNAVNGTTPIGDGSVSSITASSATTFQVKFNGAVDTSKITADVTRGGTAVALTSSWDSSNSVLTLTYSSNLPEDTYTVTVKKGDTELSKKDVAITSQKIGKMEITSTTLGVTTPTTNATGTAIGGNGYAVYKVYDQYGNDITTSGIAQGITWTCGLGTVTGQNGLLEVVPFTGATNFLTQYSTCTINGVDQTTGITVTSNLTVTPTTGTLSDIKLNKLYCSNDEKAIFANGDTTDSFYIDYTAKDLSGNDTKNKKLIEAGLMRDGNGKITGLVSSNESLVKVSLVADPTNSDNGLIKVEPQSGKTVVADQPVVITMFTSNGKSSTITLTLKKDSQVDKFTLMAPSETVCAGDKAVLIPFTAYDQNGKQLTKYSDIADAVTITSGFNTGLSLISNPDGTASLQLNVDDNAVSGGLSSQSYTIQAVTNNTGKFSSLNIVVQAKAKPNTLSVTTKVAVPSMESGAVQNLDFGANFSDLTMKDQYGRVFDMSNQDTNKDYYYVKAVSSNTGAVRVNQDIAYNARNIQIQAVGGPKSGSSTVTYTVYKATGGQLPSSTDPVLNTVTSIAQTYAVVDTKDIKDYTIDKIATLYNVAPVTASGVIVPTVTTSSAIGTTFATGATDTIPAKQNWIKTSNVSKFRTEAFVYGLTSGGGKVALANTDILSVAVDNSEDFTPDLVDNYFTTATVGVYAKATLSSTKPTATGTLTVTIKSADDLVHTAYTTVTSKDEIPVAKSVGINVTKGDADEDGTNKYNKNIVYNDFTVAGNNITMSKTLFNKVNNQIMSKYSPTGAKSASPVYMFAVDQYGTKTAPFLTYNAKVTSSRKDATAPSVSIDGQGKLTASNIDAGDTITITGTTATGLVQSMNLKITN
ncbi:cell wall-binding repeat-containing protein [Clostridium sp. OS1-26]|uniref:cell wall-binding repeat-containing protein n=1 Tax=Clostridium sp. OS1-26 TaxID=3070681 RepID=UPI0027DF8FE3|nr:cell wall-binding repeat-containing protein [Clostridium sp. OS1-26]WML36731.1 cell wall-binding repeat-containing protein [Clostridium sp. OS1-26]